MELHPLGWQEVFSRIEGDPIFNACPKVWGPPRGGAIVSGLIQALGRGVAVGSAEEAEVFVDDIYDSGRTQRRVEAVWGRKPWWFVVDKRREDEGAWGWVLFPWENPVEEATIAGTLGAEGPRLALAALVSVE